MSRKRLLLLVGLLGVCAVALPTLRCVLTHNCGGNGAALAQVQVIALIAHAGASTAADHSFDFATATGEQREQLTNLARSHWLDNARFLVSIGPVTEQEAAPHRIIVVCDTPYRNVPRRWIVSAPPTHAAAFADGSAALITPTEFAALDRSAFTPLAGLYPSRRK